MESMTEEENLMSEEEMRCQTEVLPAPYPLDGQDYCETFWDGWGCWNYTLAGSRAFISCPPYIAGFDPKLKAYRDCMDDGMWWRSPQNRTWSNYTPCINIGELAKNTRLIYVYIAGYSLSIIAVAISIAIFFFFRRQLQCDRVRLHNHLFSSYIFNGAAWILYYTVSALDASVISENPLWCRALHVVTQYFVTCNFMWMFCEGLYLHTIIVRAFTSGNKLIICCYAIGWGVAVVTTAVYTGVRSTIAADSAGCWLKESNAQWIVSGPILATLIMNLFFLCNIVRVLVTKLRAVNSPDTVQTKKAVRATLILIPLLGLQFILFPMRPREGSMFEEPYFITVAVVTSLQGVFVAVLFCFLNGEVMTVFRRHWHQRSLFRCSGGHVMGGASPTRQMSFNSHTTMSMAEYAAANNGINGPNGTGSKIYRSGNGVEVAGRGGSRKHPRRANSLGDALTAHPLCGATAECGVAGGDNLAI